MLKGNMFNVVKAVPNRPHVVSVELCQWPSGDSVCLHVYM
jgi:hypothetical protein